MVVVKRNALLVYFCSGFVIGAIIAGFCAWSLMDLVWLQDCRILNAHLSGPDMYVCAKVEKTSRRKER